MMSSGPLYLVGYIFQRLSDFNVVKNLSNEQKPVGHLEYVHNMPHENASQVIGFMFASQSYIVRFA